MKPNDSKFVTRSELARQLQITDATLRDRITRRGVEADAELRTGARLNPLFLEARISELAGVLGGSPVSPASAMMH